MQLRSERTVVLCECADLLDLARNLNGHVSVDIRRSTESDQNRHPVNEICW